ncbi:nucleoporin NDC1 [Ambystoma mexicanum]|uniref:nucleoporin NDC1 n=1 Tax=Ambystoma mexicanum TaxID=8296 RepID=UPI0037E779B3
MTVLSQDHWFLTKVLSWREAASIAWSVLLMPLCTVTFIFLSRVDLLHPLQWATDSLGDLGSSYTLFCMLLMSAAIVIISVFNLEFYTVVPSIPCSRFALIGKVIHPRQVVHSIVHAMMGMLLAWCAAVLTKGQYQYLAVPCTATESPDVASPHTCLNEYHLFILLAGAFMGYSYSLQYFIQNMNYLPFPAIQQYKYLSFRRSVSLLIKHGCVESLYLVRNFFIAYYLLGYVPRAWIGTTMNFQKDNTLPPLDSLSGLLSLSLFYHTWLCGIFILITWYVAWVLFKIYTTEAYIFPVQPTFAQETDRCLPAVLSNNPPLIVKYLALQDLRLLSQYSPSRRQEVFCLSQPGGHPHNWTAISRECISLLTSLTSKLVAHQEAAATNGRVKIPSATGELKTSSSSSGSSFTNEMPSHMQRDPNTPMGRAIKLNPDLNKTSMYDLGSPFGSPAVIRLGGLLDQNSPWHGSIQSPHIMRRGAKLWSADSDMQINGSKTSESSPVPVMTVHKAERPSALHMWFQNKLEQVKAFLSRRMLVMYLFSKHPEASNQDLFSDAQTHIWALEGLSHLVAASYTEDTFGVVQTTLPSILSTFLILLEAVDKHFKLPHASSKPTRISGSFVDTSYKTLRFALRASLKTAIYRITTTFGEHLNSVQTSVEHRKRLQQFLEYRE